MDFVGGLGFEVEGLGGDQLVALDAKEVVGGR